MRIESGLLFINHQIESVTVGSALYMLNIYKDNTVITLLLLYLMSRESAHLQLSHVFNVLEKLKT